MRPIYFGDLAQLVTDPVNCWSIGIFGATAEFRRDPPELSTLDHAQNSVEIATARGAMRVMRTQLHAIAWDSLSADGVGWGHSLAFCVPVRRCDNAAITALGRDIEAIRPQDRESWLFDLGVGAGCVRMCVRTRDAALATALARHEGASLLASCSLFAEMMRAQPHRVMLSTAGRIEVFQPIPPPHSVSPDGPHTHLLPRLLGAGRLHSANDPVPRGWQPALTLHQPAPWQGSDRILDIVRDAEFAPMLEPFSLAEDARVAAEVVAAIETNGASGGMPWPMTRRGRIKLRITLRRLAAAGDPRAAQWRERHDLPGMPSLDDLRH